ncbi:NACHT domain-containing NTPase [Dongia sp.]|uniref:NACHT domain-containing protein n=1 Tax=Dongia sp. TaxID=1977262 RepID=UPI0035B3D233
MTPEERRSPKNGIWMCRDHGTAIDSKDSEFTAERLREWQALAHKDSLRRLLNHEVPYRPGLASPSEITTRLTAAATADLEVLRRTTKWPSTSVELSLSVKEFSEPASTSALANAVISLDDLILVAPPGMGKTTTLFQIAEGMLASGSGIPLFVSLGDWATGNLTLLDAILKRPALRGLSEDDFRIVAAQSGVVLLLDGWNELDSAGRKRAAVQISTLKAELPELGLIVSTRKQGLDVPFVGVRVELLPLDRRQQMEIATAVRGASGRTILEQAWRTPGVRDLVTIPLYLTVLLALPEEASFPATKEEVLRRFVGAHETDTRNAEALRSALHGVESKYLAELAVFAVTTGNTTISDGDARRIISAAAKELIADGQIESCDPSGILDALVSNHVLIRSSESQGYSFQHQQFQEWYASHHVESYMMKAIDEVASREKLKADIFDNRSWEEAVLFAVERLGLGDSPQQKACAGAILCAFDVDPILAAEMIFRCTDAVWVAISAEIQRRINKWHKPGKADRALRFMITSGRPEFFNLLWPLITHKDKQVRLQALRAGGRFRPSILGRDAAKLIAELESETRGDVLGEIASQGGIEGLDLATAVAKEEVDSQVKADAVKALAFRQADRHILEVLNNADERTFDLLAANGAIDDIADEGIQAALKAARARQREAGVSDFQQLRSIAFGTVEDDASAKILSIVSSMEIDRTNGDYRGVFNDLSRRYLPAVAEGLLKRVYEGSILPYGADGILAAARLAIDDEVLIGIALTEESTHSERAEAAASVLGPVGVGRLIKEYLEVGRRLHGPGRKYNQAASERYYDLRERIGHTPAASLLAAVQAFADAADSNDASELAGLLGRGTESMRDQVRSFGPKEQGQIGLLALQWGERMLASGDAATRWHIASIARLIAHAPSPSLLPLLKRLLDEDLRRVEAFRIEANANGWQPGRATDEARISHSEAYKSAFLAIRSPQTSTLAKEYLLDKDFGKAAAIVLSVQWEEQNGSKDDERRRIGPNFSSVAERRLARASQPTATSEQAEAIFGAIDKLLVDESSADQKNLAIELGIVGARLPHGERRSTIQELMALAGWRSRPALVLALVLSGEEVDISIVAAGIAEVFERAREHPWILADGNGYALRDWLQLLPFVNAPGDSLPIILNLPEQFRTPQFLEHALGLFAEAPSGEAENVLFRLAEEAPSFYASRHWREAVLKRGTLSAMTKFIDLSAQGAIDWRTTDEWHIARQVGEWIERYPQLRMHVYDLLKTEPISSGHSMLAQAVAENPDAEGLLLLVGLESVRKHGRSFIGRRTVERIVTKHVPSEDWVGTFYAVPIAVTELRRKLFEMTALSEVGDVASRCLNLIETLRDDFGYPESEPRHPDLGSARPWPQI